MLQDFVDRYPNSVCTKYVIADLANHYRLIGRDAKALRKLLKIADSNTFVAERVKLEIGELKSKLCPVRLIPDLPEGAPIPPIPPCDPNTLIPTENQ